MERLFMDICYATDSNFFMQTAVSLISVIQTSDDTPITFHILDAGLTNDQKTLLSTLVTDNCQVVFYNVVSRLESLKETGQRAWGDFPSYATWARLFIPEVLPNDVSSLLYLDGDVIASSNWTSLIDFDFHGALLAGVEDCVASAHKISIGFPPSKPYVNAGVLLFNLTEWRKSYSAIWPKKYLTSHFCYPMADQDVINLMFQNSTIYLPIKYNYSVWFRLLDIADLSKLLDEPFLCRHSQSEIDLCARHRAVFTHFNSCNLVIRPWYRHSTDPARNLWYSYYKLSPWRNQRLLIEPRHFSIGESWDRFLYRIFGRKYYFDIHEISQSLKSKMSLKRHN